MYFNKKAYQVIRQAGLDLLLISDSYHDHKMNSFKINRLGCILFATVLPIKWNYNKNLLKSII